MQSYFVSASLSAATDKVFVVLEPAALEATAKALADAERLHAQSILRYRPPEPMRAGIRGR
jgi:hypothetical protein